jgi:hypothetical protein
MNRENEEEYYVQDGLTGQKTVMTKEEMEEYSERSREWWQQYYAKLCREFDLLISSREYHITPVTHGRGGNLVFENRYQIVHTDTWNSVPVRIFDNIAYVEQAGKWVKLLDSSKKEAKNEKIISVITQLENEDEQLRIGENESE